MRGGWLAWLAKLRLHVCQRHINNSENFAPFNLAIWKLVNTLEVLLWTMLHGHNHTAARL